MPKHINRHGTHQEIHIGRFKTDRYGVVSGSVQRHRAEEYDKPEWKYVLPTAAPGVVLGVPCVGVEREYDAQRAMAIYTYTFEGVAGDDLSFEDRVFCTLEGTDSEEPIETHPEFDAIYRKYKGRQEPGTSKFGYFEKLIEVGGKKQVNPLFGVTHFLSVGLVWTRNFVSRGLPHGILSRVDCIDHPQGHGGMQPPVLKGKRNWLQLAPTAQQRGNVVQVAQRWLASGKNGWNPDIYGEKHSAGS